MTVSTEQFNVVNVGTVANDGTGDSLRAAFVKINQNFSDFIEGTGFATGNITLTGAIESQGNISTDSYFIGDGRFVTNVTVSNDYVPTANTDPGTTGQIAFDNDYVYICIAADNWKRANLAAW